MAANEIRLADIGTVFEITVQENGTPTDISSATVTKDIIFKAPGKASVTKSGSFTTNGTDGKVQYTTLAGDLNKTGAWKLQAFLVLSGGSWRTEFGEFYVHPNL